MPTRRSTRRSARQAAPPADAPPPSYAAVNSIVVEENESDLSELEEAEQEVEIVEEVVEPMEGAEEGEKVEPEQGEAPAQPGSEGEGEVEEVVPQVAKLPCVHCHKHKLVCKVLPDAKRCQGCTKSRNGCNVDGRTPDFRGEQSLLRQRIYKKLHEAALKAKPYIPVRTNASNDWTAKYLEDLLGEEARQDADVRQHLGRDAPIMAANAPASMQPLLASGSGTTGPPAYSLNNIDNPSSHKRALEANEAAIEHHERALKRARRDRRALQAMEFDEEEEKEDDSEEDP
ncbi:hypothetical protein CF327_g7517 [Tilletia walkeri]|nr:hypothetical protein CF327_g7517 [Tilletia walkeri]